MEHYKFDILTFEKEVINGTEIMIVAFSIDGDDAVDYYAMDLILKFVKDHELNLVILNEGESYRVDAGCYFDDNMVEILYKYIEDYLKQYSSGPAAKILDNLSVAETDLLIQELTLTANL